MNAAAWGPFRTDLPPEERRMRVHGLRALVLLLLPPGHPLHRALVAAEGGDGDALDIALAEIEALPALPRRRLLATYAALSRPGRG